MTDRATSGGELAQHFHADVVAPLLAAALRAGLDRMPALQAHCSIDRIS